MWLSRPEKRNALSHRMVDELQAALARFDRDGVEVVVLRADGPVFCAGADKTEFQLPPPYASERLLDLLVETDAFVLCVVESPAYGAGVAIAAAATYTLAASNATFALPEKQLGLFPAGVYAFLEPVVGPRAALQLGIDGTTLTAPEAHGLGLINYVCAPEDLDRQIERRVADLVATPDVTAQAARAWRTQFRHSSFAERRGALDAMMHDALAEWTAR